jgi:hypothetical protein
MTRLRRWEKLTAASNDASWKRRAF